MQIPSVLPVFELAFGTNVDHMALIVFVCMKRSTKSQTSHYGHEIYKKITNHHHSIMNLCLLQPLGNTH